MVARYPRRIDTAELFAAATELHAALVDLPLSLVPHGGDDLRRDASGARRQLEDYVLPRLRDVDAPMLIVVGGSTGAGKSTLVNSLVGDEVSPPGVLRPTTRSPVLIHHPAAASWFTDQRILGSLARVHGGVGEGPSQLGLVARTTMPETIALLDAPDVDSVVDANREVATQLLAAADLWVFVTTAARYADLVPWTFLRAAVARGVHVAVVLNRVPPGAADEVGSHLAEMMRGEGLGGAPVFTIDEQVLPGGRLPDQAIQPLRAWLAGFATDQQARAAVIRRSLAGTLGELSATADRLADAVEYQGEMVAWLGDRVGDAFDRARERIEVDIRDGMVMRGEVLARWQELVGTGELFRQLQSTIGRARDRLASAVTGRPPPTERFQGAVSAGVEALVGERTADAVDEVVLQWRSQPSGQAVLAESARGRSDDIERPSADLAERTTRTVRDWQAGVLDLLRREGAGKRRTAKALSYGVNGLGAVTMVGVFASTGGLTGAEVVIAGGTTAAGSKVLEAVLGDQAVRTLTEVSRRDLGRRIDEDLLGPERQRFVRLLDPHRPAGQIQTLRAVARRLARGVDR